MLIGGLLSTKPNMAPKAHVPILDPSSTTTMPECPLLIVSIYCKRRRPAKPEHRVLLTSLEHTSKAESSAEGSAKTSTGPHAPSGTPGTRGRILVLKWLSSMLAAAQEVIKGTGSPVH